MLEEMAPCLGIVAHADHWLDEPPRSLLPRIVDAFLRSVQQPVIGRFVHVLLSEAARHPSVAAFFAKRGPLGVLTFLERYMARQVDLGRLFPPLTLEVTDTFLNGLAT
jgi:hypothetical protein